MKYLPKGIAHAAKLMQHHITRRSPSTSHCTAKSSLVGSYPVVSSYLPLPSCSCRSSSHVAPASTIVSTVELLFPSLLIYLEISLFLVLILAPLVLCGIRSKTTYYGAQYNVALAMLLSELSASQSANNGTSDTDAQTTSTCVECALDFVLDAAASLA